ncbi:SMI1/KNR4 family protein [Streptomyces gobiensis]|uniref:SMI1/KNR4 family protein n=1 Tax=Streptomyces gobiensis TaxID=2875706 RepID=UPI001E50E00D|nr:SMI1/KNR4 family protein [Streptomyces gobiensis]UGY93055.1 SMI1/KNR4 family protein [Streptomyces gobiensis]
MLSTVDELERALPGLRALRAARSRKINWPEVVRALGTDLPSDYKELCEAYPSFSIGDFLLVATPQGSESEFAVEMMEALDVLEDLAEADMSGGYAPYPRPGGLLHCAESSSGDTFYWRTGGDDPDAWPVVVSTRNDDWWEYDEGFVSLLAGLISGEVTPWGLPEPFLGSDAEVKLA